MSLLGISGFS